MVGDDENMRWVYLACAVLVMICTGPDLCLGVFPDRLPGCAGFKTHQAPCAPRHELQRRVHPRPAAQDGRAFPALALGRKAKLTMSDRRTSVRQRVHVDSRGIAASDAAGACA